jgi:WhiB family redox-sensing transcriptional regulator
VDPELFHPERGQNPDEAKRICTTSCDVVDQCFVYIMAHPELGGVWAGTTERERGQMRRRARERRERAS